MATAPDGAVLIGIGPKFLDRYGSISVTRRHTRYNGTVTDYESFPISAPHVGDELIDMSKPLRPESRSAFVLGTQEEVLERMKGSGGHDEQHFQ